MGVALRSINSIPTDNLLFCVDAANTKSYSGSGSTWTDIISGHDVTLYNSPTFNIDNGGSIVFDDASSSEYAQSSASSDLILGTKDYAMSIWFKFHDLKTEIGLLDNRTAHGNGTCFSINQSGSYMRIKVWEDNSSGYAFQSTTDLSTNTWYNITYTRVSNSASMYINGVKDGSSWSQSHNYSAGNKITIGWNYSEQSGKSLDGNVSHVLFYVDKSFTDSEVKQNFDVLKGRFGL